MSTDIRASEARGLGADAGIAVAGERRSTYLPQLALALLTVACLLPFSGKAFHIDDPIFIWTAQQITHHPLDPYGFTQTWWNLATPMWQIQQNPPGAAYYMALVGSVAGWSERALHIGFMLPAIVVVLATYRLARRFTGNQLIAAAATLVAPAFLVSSTTVMCDVSMLALWMLATVFWVEGLEEPTRPAYLAISGILIAACTLTKYFGVSLIPLLFVYSLMRRRGVRGWIAYLAIPVLILGAYEFYTYRLYGHGLITEAVLHKSYVRETEGPSGRALVGLVFAGGCALPALTFVSLLWSRRQLFWGALAGAVLALCFWRGWINLGTVYQYQSWLHHHLLRVSMQLFFYVGGGISLLALAIADFRRNRNALSLLLLLWILGTMFFAVVVNWTVNARSLLPMIPAVAILIARRLELLKIPSGKPQWAGVAACLLVSLAVSLSVAAGDMATANSARTAANYMREKSRDDLRPPWFEGRWGFEYYMQVFGARPAQPDGEGARFADLVVIPKYNTALFRFPLKVTGEQTADFDIHTWVTAMNPDAGAGFYFSGWGPLPFAFGPVPQQRYLMARVVQEK